MKAILHRREFGLYLVGAAAGSLIAAPATTIVTGRLRDWRSLAPPKKFDKAFEYLMNTDTSTFSVGRHAIDGDRMYVNIADAPARDPKEGRFETHRKYADVHYLVRGREMIGHAKTADMKPAVPYNAEQDIEFFTATEYQKIILEVGSFAIFEPGQSHLPGCDSGTGGNVRKAVIKVLMV